MCILDQKNKSYTGFFEVDLLSKRSLITMILIYMFLLIFLSSPATYFWRCPYLAQHSLATNISWWFVWAIFFWGLLNLGTWTLASVIYEEMARKVRVLFCSLNRRLAIILLTREYIILGPKRREARAGGDIIENVNS
jgi:hypothetical protein